MISKLRFVSLIILFCFVFQLTAGAQIVIKNPKDKIPADPTIKIGVLSNGMKYYIKQNKKPEKRMELRLAVSAGAILENDNQNGLAHFCEHMAFNGTKTFPKNELINYLESIGMRFGGDLNAYTSFDETVYMVQAPTDNKEQMDKAIQVIEDWAAFVSYDDKEIDKERGVIIEEWRLGKGPDDRCQKKHYPKIFYKSHYADRDVIGDTNVLANFTYETLKSFYKDWYRPNLMAVIAVGDFSIEEMEAKIKEHFGKLENPPSPKTKPVFPVPIHDEPLFSVATDKELSNSMLEVMIKHEIYDESTYEGFKRSIVERLFGTMLTKRFDELRRKAKPPFMYAGAGSANYVETSRIFYLYGVLFGESMMDGIETTLTEAFRVMQHGFTEGELERTKKDEISSLEKAFAEKDKTESRVFASEYVRNFLDDEPIPGIAYELPLITKFLNEITLNEVNALSKTLITKNGVVVTVNVIDKEGVKVPTEAELSALYDKITSKKLDAWKDDMPTTPLFSKKVTPGTITKETKNNELGLTEWTLSNGVKVFLKTTDFKNDEIIFQSYKYGGTSLASDEDYLSAAMAPNIINQSGVAEFTETQLQKMLTGKIVNVNAGIGGLTEAINGNCAVKDIETMFQLIYLQVTSPRKDKEACESFIGKMREQLKEKYNDPDNFFYDTVYTILAQNHLRGKSWSEDMINKVDLDKAYKFYSERYANANDFNFFFMGNFDIEKIKPYVLKYIASLPSNNSKENWKDVGIRKPEGKKNYDIYKGIESKSNVWLTISDNYEWTPENNYVYESMMEIFRIRLREVLREDKGGVYGVGAFGSPSKYPNQEYSINVTFGCNPERVNELIDAVKGVIKEMVDSVPKAENLTKVKEIQSKEREKRLKENGYWLGNIRTSYFNNDNVMEFLNREKRIAGLTAEDIQKAAKKYFGTDNFIKIVLYPEKK